MNKTRFLLIVFCMCASNALAQKVVKNTIPNCKQVSLTTDILLDTFKISKPKTTYDLLCNLAYLDTKNLKRSDKFIVMPQIYLYQKNDPRKPIRYDKIKYPDYYKKMRIDSIKQYTLGVVDEMSLKEPISTIYIFLK